MEKEKDKDKDKDKDKSKKTGGTLRKFGKRKTTTGTLTNEDLKMMAQIAVEEAAAATPVETGEYNLKIESKWRFLHQLLDLLDYVIPRLGVEFDLMREVIWMYVDWIGISKQ